MSGLHVRSNIYQHLLSFSYDFWWDEPLRTEKTASLTEDVDILLPEIDVQKDV